MPSFDAYSYLNPRGRTYPRSDTQETVSFPEPEQPPNGWERPSVTVARMGAEHRNRHPDVSTDPDDDEHHAQGQRDGVDRDEREHGEREGERQSVEESEPESDEEPHYR